MNNRKLLSLKDVADYLKSSVKTVRRRIASGKLKSFKEGGRRMVFEKDLNDYIENQTGGSS